MATLDVKFTKFDNRPWGFRLAGGSDFPEPLTVIRVTEGSLAECMGLKVGDVVVKLNDQPISDLTHGQAHEALVLAGNNFVLGVRRTEDPNKTIEGIEEKIEPYMLPLENILFAPVEEKRETTPDEVPQIEDESAALVEPEPEPVEVYPEKPRDANSDFVPNTNLTDEEIAQLILDEEEVLNEKGVLGVNFKKLRPRAPLLKESKVFQELQQEASIDPVAQEKEQLLKSTFLQKPDRPVPKPRTKSQSEDAEPEVEPYRVVIKKQPKKSVTERLLAKGLIDASQLSTPQASEVTEPAPTTPEPTETPEPDVCTSDTSASAPLAPGTWTLTSSIDEPEMETPDQMSPISEAAEETTSFSFDTPTTVDDEEATGEIIHVDCEIENLEPPRIVKVEYERPCGELAPASFLVVRKKTRLCRRGRYARRCLSGAFESLRCARPGKPRLLRRGRYFERIVRGLAGCGEQRQKQQRRASEESLLRVLMLASLACSLRDTYDQEILHRGSSRRNSRRMSQCRRESNADATFEAAGLLGQQLLRRKDSDGLMSLRSRCAEGRRRLSVMGMMVADKVGTAMRTDLARGLAYAFVPCASALAFFMFNYAKRLNSAAADE